MKMIKVMGMISNMDNGGAQRVLLNQAKMFMHDRDIDFTIFSYEKPTNSIYDTIIKENNIKVVYLNKKRHFFKLPFIGDFFNFFITNLNWFLAIKKYKPDVIHTHVTEILRKSFIAIKLSGVKKVYCTLHSNPYRYKGTSYYAAVISFRKFKFVPICITEEQAKMAKEYYAEFKKEIDIRKFLDMKLLEMVLNLKKLINRK